LTFLVYFDINNAGNLRNFKMLIQIRVLALAAIFAPGIWLSRAHASTDCADFLSSARTQATQTTLQILAKVPDVGGARTLPELVAALSTNRDHPEYALWARALERAAGLADPEKLRSAIESRRRSAEEGQVRRENGRKETVRVWGPIEIPIPPDAPGARGLPHDHLLLSPLSQAGVLDPDSGYRAALDPSGAFWIWRTTDAPEAAMQVPAPPQEANSYFSSHVVSPSGRLLFRVGDGVGKNGPVRIIQYRFLDSATGASVVLSAGDANRIGADKGIIEIPGEVAGRWASFTVDGTNLVTHDVFTSAEISRTPLPRADASLDVISTPTGPHVIAWFPGTGELVLVDPAGIRAPIPVSLPLGETSQVLPDISSSAVMVRTFLNGLAYKVDLSTGAVTDLGPGRGRFHHASKAEVIGYPDRSMVHSWNYETGQAQLFDFATGQEVDPSIAKGLHERTDLSGLLSTPLLVTPFPASSGEPAFRIHGRDRSWRWNVGSNSGTEEAKPFGEPLNLRFADRSTLHLRKSQNYLWISDGPALQFKFGVFDFNGRPASISAGFVSKELGQVILIQTPDSQFEVVAYKNGAFTSIAQGRFSVGAHRGAYLQNSPDGRIVLHVFGERASQRIQIYGEIP
jgi:hypothetical protein